VQPAPAATRQNCIASAPLQAEDVQDATFETLDEPTPPQDIPGVKRGAVANTNTPSPQQIRDLWTVATKLGFKSNDDDKTYIREFYSWLVERDTVASVKDFTRAEADTIINELSQVDPEGAIVIRKAEADELLNEFNSVREDIQAEAFAKEIDEPTPATGGQS
jgi:hypothetical protein